MMLLPASIMAQSSMTDDQVFKYVIKEHQNGTSQSQIVTQLMQRGVDITQIRRVRKKFERMSKDQALGVLSNDTQRDQTDSRQRTNNGEARIGDQRYDNFRDDTRRGDDRSTYRVREGVPSTRTYDEEDDEWMEFRDELDEFLPADTATMYLNLLAKMEKDKKKVFGRDIFNKRNLSFEPSMSIATPANYRLGPGDAVFIDIYGASQKTIEGTVSPDGTVTIEGFGPVHVSGLTVEQIESIETDQNLPSLGPLIKIARALGVRLGTFMDDNDDLGPIVTRAADREKDSSISFSNDATDARKHMEYHPLAQQKAGRHMEPFVIDINPEDSPEFQLSAHEGEEFIYVMQGEVEIVYGKETYKLGEGDSIFYDSIVKHHVHGAPGKSAKILAVVYIPF